MLAAAADDVEPFGPRGGKAQKEPPRFGNLAGEERRLPAIVRVLASGVTTEARSFSRFLIDPGFHRSHPPARLIESQKRSQEVNLRYVQSC